MPRKKSCLKKMMNKFPAVCISIKASIKRSVTVVIVRASVCWIKNNLLKLISQSHQTVLLNFFYCGAKNETRHPGCARLCNQFKGVIPNILNMIYEPGLTCL